MSRRTGKRTLSEEDRRLWEEVRRSVKPLPARPLGGEAPDPPVGLTEENLSGMLPPAKPEKPARQPLPSWSPTATPPKAGAVRPLDEKTARKLKKGRLAIDARIDLHGMAEMQAHHALTRFLDSARRQDHRIVLVITGKGERSGGILRRAVPRWLAEPPLSALVGAWRQAHISHGGEGALYVRLRRDRTRT